MRYLISLLVLLLSVSSFGQITIEKDSLRSHFMEIASESNSKYSYNCSPDCEWILECYNYYNWNAGDSSVLSIYHRSDLQNKIHIMTFNSSGSSGQITDIHNNLHTTATYRGVIYSNDTWSNNLDTIYVSIEGSTINSSSTGFEVFAIDISSITGIGIKNPSNNFPTNRVKALNKPNPFRSSTSIQYSIPKSNYVAINIYNNQGRLLRVLKQKYQKAGTYSVKWDGKDNNGNRMANGEYYYQIVSGDMITTKKMIFLR